MSMAERHIVAVGNGGASDSIFDAILALARRQPPRVLFVGTASAEDPSVALAMYERLRDRARVTHLDFFPWPPADLRELALEQDVIFVGGGNTANMLAIW